MELCVLRCVAPFGATYFLSVRRAQVREKYLYNPGTHTLHIVGYCCHTNGIKPEYKPFNTENEALAYDGRGVRMCKICQKEREKRLGEK